MLRGEPWIAVIGTAVLIMYKCLEFTHSEKKGTRSCIYLLPPFITFQLTILVFIVARTGMAGVPGTAHAIFGAVKDVGANVIMISQVP